MTKIRYLFLFVAVLSQISAYSADNSANDLETIIGGTAVRAKDAIAGSTVLLLGRELTGAQFICTASILSKDVLLTAAHCLGQNGSASLKAIFRTNINGAGPVIEAEKTVRHERFSAETHDPRGSWDDVALVKLSKEIPSNYHPVSLLPQASALKNGGAVILAGYGIKVPVAAGAASGAGTLRKVKQTILNARYSPTEILVSLKNNKGACHGDSGGPAIVEVKGKFYVAGIASRLTEKDRVAENGNQGDFACSKEMVYTSVVAEIDWIRNQGSRLSRDFHL